MITASHLPDHPGPWPAADRGVVTDPSELFALLGLEPDLLPAARRAAAVFGLRVPRSYIARMRRGDPTDPLLRQVLPLDVELEERPSHEIVAAVAGGLADAGIVADTVDLGGLERHPFALDRLVVVGRRDHPALAGRRGLSLAEVAEHELVGLAAGSALQAHLEQHAGRVGRRLRLRVRVASLDAVCRMAGMGVGLAIVPERAARRGGRSSGLRTVALSDAWALRQLHVCTRRLEDLPAHARHLVERLRQHGSRLAAVRD